jgi:hypothetical protein
MDQVADFNHLAPPWCDGQEGLNIAGLFVHGVESGDEYFLTISHW